ncbi:MAG: DUF2153 family protein [Candidatus Bathyarchaeia archaeon]
MNENWIETSEKVLEQIRKFSQKKEKDRLDLVQSMRFTLFALNRSLLGWMSWVNNPDIMASFKLEDLEEMNRKLTEFVEEFIKYDMEATRQGARKSGAALEARQEAEERVRRTPEDAFYI